ncbi:MAG: glycerol-3-phosphate dehydrogenase [Lautropia sp.]
MPSASPAAPPPPRSRDVVDVVIVGGGVNGCGIARDLAGRGCSVVLCEKDDLASHTSSASTKLIHGGLRYLEHYEFGLVRKALREREVLLKSAPHIMSPLRFVMPHDPSMRPAWLVRLGLLMYDHLAQREVLPGSHGIALHRHAAGAALQPRFSRGFVYSDGWVDDARLVVLCARDAADRNAEILTRTGCADARREGDVWSVRLVAADGAVRTVRARALVNAAGPWAGQFLHDAVHRSGSRNLRLIKGSHIVVRRLFEHDHAYILQSPDQRVVFAIPYESRFTLIGTTDVEVTGDPGAAAISSDETAYLCTVINRCFRRAIGPADVVWSYAGVRPLLDDASGDPSAVTRDYALELDRAGAPLLSVWGGKITTFRKLAEEAAGQLLAALGERRPAWTRGRYLPGGDLSGTITVSGRPDVDIARFREALACRLPWLPAPLLARYVRAYGSRVPQVVGPAAALADLGAEIAPGLHEAELSYLVREEWAVSGDDVLWRRSKLGLHLDAAQRAAVDRWMAGARAVAAAA